VLVAEYTQDAERVRRFKQEPIAASALNHPAIPSMRNRHQVKDPFYHHTVYAIACIYALEGNAALPCLIASERLRSSWSFWRE
jgi:hypothetical protein